MDVADISIMEPYMKSSGQDLKTEMVGLGDGLGVRMRGNECSVEIRFSIKEV